MKSVRTIGLVMTLNEELHISRCLDALKLAVDQIFVIDSYSTDATVEIAKSKGAVVLSHPWVNHGHQFNWALGQLPPDTDWVLRVDADEVVSIDLTQSITENLSSLDQSFCGLNIKRRIIFQGKKIQFGGCGRVRVLRLFRYGSGKSETRWMDEHIQVVGKIADLKGDLVDHNLKPLAWWIEKHNQYANYEAIELLKLKYSLGSNSPNVGSIGVGAVGTKRWIKENIYIRLPTSIRALLYFLYRYFLRLGFLDGASGFQFHFLQGFWYRYLVDSKVCEIERLAREQKKSIPQLILELYHVDVTLA